MGGNRMHGGTRVGIHPLFVLRSDVLIAVPIWVTLCEGG
jgi:hypothetical protein